MFDRLWSNLTSGLAQKQSDWKPDRGCAFVARQAFAGGQMRIWVPARVICPACSGRGVSGPTNAGVVKGTEH